MFELSDQTRSQPAGGAFEGLPRSMQLASAPFAHNGEHHGELYLRTEVEGSCLNLDRDEQRIPKNRLLSKKRCLDVERHRENVEWRPRVDLNH